MKQVTAQQFANMFGVYVAKEVKDSSLFAYELKPVQQAFEDGTYWCMTEDCFSIEITPLISDADSLDWSVLIEPQEEFLNIGDNKCTRPDAECHARRQDGICMNGIICKPAEPSPVPFDENYAPEGCKAVKKVDDCKGCHFYSDEFVSDDDPCVLMCDAEYRPDRTDVYFVKKE